MSFKYGHPATAINGVLNYIQTKYPSCKLLETLKEGIPKDQWHARINLSGLNNFMREYRQQKGSNPSKVIDKNAFYIQQDFKPFAEYCKQKLK